MSTPLEILDSSGIRSYLYGYSALDRYFHIPDPGSVFILAETSLVELAGLFDRLEFGAGEQVDATITSDETHYFVTCEQEGRFVVHQPFTVQSLIYDHRRDVFLDPRNVYGDLRREELQRAEDPVPEWMAVLEGARMVSRYHYRAGEQVIGTVERFPELTTAAQRRLLESILLSRNSHRGLELLERAGFVAAHWPELAALRHVGHLKDYHPEGDVWKHTLETLKHRKRPRLSLSLALLFHDAGKCVAVPQGSRRFDNHSNLGAPIAARFLRRLGFSDRIIEEVSFLIRFHMLPAALGRLPEYRSAPVMSSPLFPDLLELYYADISSSYRSPEGYYEACRIYRRFLGRRRKNEPVLSPRSGGGRTRKRARTRSHW